MRLRMRAGGSLIGLVAAAALVAGCGGSGASGSSSLSGSSGSGSSGSGNTPTVSLSRAADVSSTASGYRVAMDMQETVPNTGQIHMTGTGSFSPAAHLGAATMQMELPSTAGTAGTAGTGTLQLGMVLDKTTVYMKLPATLTSKIPGGKPWLYINLNQAGQVAGIPGLGSLVSSSSSLNDPGQYLDYLRATSASSVKSLGQATVNGVRTTEYHAVVDMTKLPNAVPAAQRQTIQQLVNTLKSKGLTTQMPIDVWIDSSNLVRRVQLAFSEPLPNTGQTVSIAMTENFLQYGPQPVPAIPSASESANLLSLLPGSS